jgi:lipoyl(octanoyl) transferase
MIVMERAAAAISANATTEPALQVYLLGSVDFESALAWQRRLAYQVAGDRASAYLILCEHPPIITVGRQGSRGHIRFDLEELQLRGWRVRWVNRGGGCFLHLPGQLAVYPILALDHWGLGLQAYLEKLHQVLADVLADFSIPTMTVPGRPGLWVGGRLIAGFGLAVRDWVTYYGGLLNIDPDLEPFRRISCGGPAESPMTSLVRERHGPLRHSLVRERLVEHFAARFGFPRVSLFFGHPALSTKALSNAVAASH